MEMREDSTPWACWSSRAFQRISPGGQLSLTPIPPVVMTSRIGVDSSGAIREPPILPLQLQPDGDDISYSQWTQITI